MSTRDPDAAGSGGLEYRAAAQCLEHRLPLEAAIIGSRITVSRAYTVVALERDLSQRLVGDDWSGMRPEIGFTT